MSEFSIGGGVLNSVDAMRRNGGYGDKQLAYAKMLETRNPFHGWLNTQICSHGTTHKYQVQKGLPNFIFKALGEGVAPSKGGSETREVDTAFGESRCLIPVDLLSAGARTSNCNNLTEKDMAILSQESMDHLINIGQVLEDDYFYGSSKANSKKFNGIFQYYSDPKAESGRNIVNVAGGNGTNSATCTSILLVNTGRGKISKLIPDGETGYIQSTQVGQHTEQDSDGKAREVYLNKFNVAVGLTVEDWRYAVRALNIDTEKLLGDDRPDLMNIMMDMIDLLESTDGGKVGFFMNRKTHSALRKQAQEKVKVGGGLTYENVEGEHILMLNGIPIYTTDHILNTEAGITSDADAKWSESTRIAS